jgi:predicted RNA-binding Zn-ribbon protein involved in translation (DUF1610 family)
LPSSDPSATGAANKESKAYCPACRIQLHLWAERRLWKCTNCGKETPLDQPVPRNTTAKGVRAITQGPRTVLEQRKDGRDPISMAKEKRKKMVHPLDRELVDLGFEVKDSVGT